MSLSEPADPFDAGPFPWVPRPLPLAPTCAGAGRRALVTALVVWVPLVVLAAIQGLAWRAQPHEAVLRDFAVYGRYLVAAPVLVYASAITLPLMSLAVRAFAVRNLVRERDRPEYERLVLLLRRLLTSRWADLTIVVLAYVVTVTREPTFYPSHLSTWARPALDGAATQLSLAGWWRMLVSQPLFDALLGVWLWRLSLWAWFLARMTRFDLSLVAAHPDRLGGLGFVLLPLRGFGWLAFAAGAVAAGVVSESVLVDGAPLPSFQLFVAAQVIAVVVVLAGPALVWMKPLVRLRESGMRGYGLLASRVGQMFQRRWIEDEPRIGTEALGAQDFSATTDLYSIVANVRGINSLVLEPRVLLMLAGATLVPYVPLLLTVIPLEQILRLALRAVA